MSVKNLLCPLGHVTSFWNPGTQCCGRCNTFYATVICTAEQPPPPKKEAPPATVKPAAWALCGGCGELYQPKTRKDKVCSVECEPLEVLETSKARAHAEKVRAGHVE